MFKNISRRKKQGDGQRAATVTENPIACRW